MNIMSMFSMASYACSAIIIMIIIIILIINKKKIKEIYDNIFHVQLFELSKKNSNTRNFQVYTYFL